MDNQEVITLLKKYDLGECTEEEKALIETWYLHQPEGSLDVPVHELNKDLDLIQQNLTAHIQTRRVYFWPRIAAAASVMAVLCLGGYLLLHHKQPSGPIVQNNSPADVPPGGNKAMLTLGNGAKIVLDSAANGILAQQGNTSVSKLNNGQLAYNILHEKPTGAPTSIVYNMLTTPRGGQYQLTLPDGTKVWLNASSSIRYPTVFTGDQRMVELNGEGYFEVRANAHQPFVVSSGTTKIIVLGTHIDIHNYPEDQAVKTTLLEGKVAVSNGRQEKELRPGEQSSISLINQEIKVKKANEDEVLAWMRGKLSTGEVDVKTLMYNISRWYDVDISFKGRAPDRRFWALINRNVYLSDVMQVLEANGIHVRLEGKTLTVLE